VGIDLGTTYSAIARLDEHGAALCHGLQQGYLNPQGAALHAGLLLARNQGQPPRFSIRNVNSHSLGVVGTDPKTRRKRAAIIVPPAQTPVLVRFQYAANGRLTISVKVGEHGKEVIQEITRVNGLSPEHLEAWRQWVAQGMG
jgi:molecular chaperone DnaK (HSP70)